MADNSGIEAWQTVLRDLSTSGDPPTVQRSTANLVKRWFDGLVGEGWLPTTPLFRKPKHTSDARTLGLRTRRPLDSSEGAAPSERLGHDLQVQVVVGPELWGIRQDEATLLASAEGVQTLGPRKDIFVLQQGEEAPTDDDLLRSGRSGARSS